MDPSNIISERTRKDKGTVYDRSREPLLSHRDIAQHDEDEDGTGQTDDRQDPEREVGDTLTGSEEEEQNNTFEDMDKDKDDEEVKDENTIDNHIEDTYTIYGNKITTVTRPLQVKVILGKARLEVEMAKTLKILIQY